MALSSACGGLTTRGSAALSDQHTFGDVTSTLSGNGIPANGGDGLSAAQLVVDYTDCTYTITGQVAVLVGSSSRNIQLRGTLTIRPHAS